MGKISDKITFIDFYIRLMNRTRFFKLRKLNCFGHNFKLLHALRYSL
jgi:hypothetical protein